MQPVLLHDRRRCVRCGECVSACPAEALSSAEGAIRADRRRCVGCGGCVSVCPTGANALSGRSMTLSEIMAVVRRDLPYYRSTGGGLTLSGGEPLLQSAAAELLAMAREDGIFTCVETTAFVQWEALEAALPHTGRFFVDYKHPDAETLFRATGALLSTVEDNLRRLADTGAGVTLRTPVIPGFNDDPAVLERCFSFARSLGLSEYVLLPYHSLGREKYRKLDLPYAMEGVPVMNGDQLAPLAEEGTRMGFSVRIGG